MACRTGCQTRDHATYAECVRSAHIVAQWLGGTRASAGDHKRFDRDNDRKRQAFADGLMPIGYGDESIRRAYEAAERSGA